MRDGAKLPATLPEDTMTISADGMCDQARTLMQMAARCQNPTMAASLTAVADKLMELARQQSEICDACPDPRPQYRR
jgi:hypothetical protein